MGTTNRSEDAEMTTILSSIRKMIVDDLNGGNDHPKQRSDNNIDPVLGQVETPSYTPEQFDDALPLTRLLKDDGSVVHLEDKPNKTDRFDDADTRVFYGFKPTESQPTDVADETISQTYESYEPAFTDHQWHGAEGAARPENPYFSDTWRPRSFQDDQEDIWTPTTAADPTEPTPPVPETGVTADLWIDPAVGQKTKNAFDALIAARGKTQEPEKKPIPETPNTLDSFMRDLLKPMVKEWLDQNLPHIVERQVQIQIDHLVSGLEDPRSP